jgi:putative membrane protein
LKKPLQELSPGLLKKPLQESSQGLLQMPDPVKTEALSNNPDSGPVFWESFIYPAKFFLFGALAITAMLLPGISGSFVLLLLGAYFEILGAVNTRDYFLVLVFGAGCAAGILVFGRIIEYLLKKYSNSTMAFMTGLVAGSLYVIWPFKKTVMIFDKTVYLSNTLPGAFNTNFIYTVISFAAGTVLVLLSIKLSASEKSSS